MLTGEVATPELASKLVLAWVHKVDLPSQQVCVGKGGVDKNQKSDHR